jgi:hypothetical protein
MEFHFLLKIHPTRASETFLSKGRVSYNKVAYAKQPNVEGEASNLN